MKAIRYTSYGGIERMALAEVPTPVPADGEVLIRVIAAGVNPVDIAVSQGYLKDFRPLSFPIIAGSEMAGTVEAIGRDVHNITRGDAVHAVTGISGAFAEFIALRAADLVRKSRSMSFAQAAGLPVAAGTAAAVLKAGAVGPGTRLLIHAAAGGVGSVIVQIAKAGGAEVIALASQTNIEFVKSLGADRVVDRATRYEDELRDIDVVLDAFGPPAQARSWVTLRKGGILLSIVAPPSQEEAAKYGVRAAMVYGDPTAESLSLAGRLFEEEKLKIHVSRTYALAQAKDALSEVATGKVRGKIVLAVTQP